mgnify:CR=1 FL=1
MTLIYAFKGPLAEGAGSAVFFRRDWRSFDFGFCFALDLIFFRVLPRLSPRALRGAENMRRAVQHSFRPGAKIARRPTSLGEGGFKGINRSLPFPRNRVNRYLAPRHNDTLLPPRRFGSIMSCIILNERG